MIEGGYELSKFEKTKSKENRLRNIVEKEKIEILKQILKELERR